MEQEKIDAFLKEYKELTEKHKIDFVNFPMYIPDGQNGFKTIIQTKPVDLTKMAQPSPFMEDAKKT